MITREVVAERSDGPIPFSIPWFIVAAVLAAAAVAVWLGLPPSAGRIAGVVLLAVAVLVTAGVAVYYLVRRAGTPEDVILREGDTFFFPKGEFAAEELWRVRRYRPPHRSIYAPTWGKIVVELKDGRRLTVHCVADVDGVYAYFIGVIQKFSKEDALR